ncbi:hypothetical protein GCM10007387_09220 [Pseudoduganella albidiflava]|nr:hypothetical protein GCM10007387_09220 [Pseudoduganella albidiflava]
MINGVAPHAAKLKSTFNEIPHFSKPDSALEKAFDFSNVPASRDAMIGRKGESIKSVLEDRCPYGGFIAALNDPVGITNDLSELTCPTEHAGFDENMYRGMICTNLIKSIEYGVRHEARATVEGEMLLELAAEINPEVAQGDAIGKIWKMVKAGGLTKYIEQQKSDIKKYGNTKEGRISSAQDRAWSEITTDGEGNRLLDSARMAAFPSEYIKSINEYEPTGAKLADLHRAWLASGQLSGWMEGTHDEADIRSGYAYRESLAQCIGKAVGTNQCQLTLERWMTSGKLSDTKNLYARALLFNQKDILEAAETDIRGSDFKPKYILSIYKGALGRVAKNQAEKLVDRLALTTANFLARALGQANNTIMRNLALASLSLQARTFISATELTRKNLSDWIVATALDKGAATKNDFAALYASARKEAKRVLPKYRMGPVVCAFELDIKGLESEGRIQPGALKTVGIPTKELIKKWLGSSAEFNTGVVGVILQIVALYFASEDVSRSDRFDKAKFDAKLAVATVSLSATLVECVTSTLEKKPEHPLSKTLLGQWALGGGKVSGRLRLAKGVGAFAGVINAGIDIWSAWGAWQDGDLLLASAYTTSAIVCGGLAYAGFSMGSAMFWYLFALAFVLGLIIGHLRPPPLKKWISRCYFSSQILADKAKRYAALDEELEAFNDAARG